MNYLERAHEYRIGEKAVEATESIHATSKLILDLAKGLEEGAEGLRERVREQVSGAVEFITGQTISSLSPQLLPLAAGTGGYEDPAFLDIVQDAQKQQQSLEIVYWTRAEMRTERKIDPYQVFWLEGHWYTNAFCHFRKEIRTFRIDWISECSGLLSDYEVLSTLPTRSRRAQIKKSLAVKVRIDTDIAAYVKNDRWHPSQEIEERMDGSLIVTFKLNELSQVKRWAMAFGRHVTVLEPPMLRESISRDLAAMSARYETV